MSGNVRPWRGVWPRFGARVLLTLRDGRSAEAEVLAPLGDPGTPLAWDEVVVKFGRLTRGIVDASGASTIAGLVRDIDRRDGRALAGALRAALKGFSEDGENPPK